MNTSEPMLTFRPVPPTAGLRLMPCPPTWTMESLLVAIFLCLPLGVAALFFSSKVERRYHVGRYDESAAASARARTLMLWGARIGAVVWPVIGWLCLTGSLRPSFITLTI